MQKTGIGRAAGGLSTAGWPASCGLETGYVVVVLAGGVLTTFASCWEWRTSRHGGDVPAGRWIVVAAPAVVVAVVEVVAVAAVGAATTDYADVRTAKSVAARSREGSAGIWTA